MDRSIYFSLKVESANVVFEGIPNHKNNSKRSNKESLSFLSSSLKRTEYYDSLQKLGQIVITLYYISFLFAREEFLPECPHNKLRQVVM